MNWFKQNFNLLAAWKLSEWMHTSILSTSTKSCLSTVTCLPDDTNWVIAFCLRLAFVIGYHIVVREVTLSIDILIFPFSKLAYDCIFWRIVFLIFFPWSSPILILGKLSKGSKIVKDQVYYLFILCLSVCLLFLKLGGQWDASAGKGVCLQAWWLISAPQTHIVEGED